MSKNASKIGMLRYAGLLHREAQAWTSKNWKATFVTGVVSAIGTVIALVLYGPAFGIGASVNQIATSVVLPLVAALFGGLFVYVLGLARAPVEIHRQLKEAVLHAETETDRVKRELAIALEARRTKDEVAAFSRAIRELVRSGNEVLAGINFQSNKRVVEPLRLRLHENVSEWIKATESELAKLGEEWCEQFKQEPELEKRDGFVPELKKLMERRIQCLRDFESDVRQGG